MTDTSRTATWDPPERPDWFETINQEGSYMDIGGVVPLDEASLLATAERNTGLSDYGADHWRVPFESFATVVRRGGPAQPDGPPAGAVGPPDLA